MCAIGHLHLVRDGGDVNSTADDQVGWTKVTLSSSTSGDAAIEKEVRFCLPQKRLV